MVFEAFALRRIFRLTAPSNLIDRSFKLTRSTAVRLL
jgi:hypothetical protein